MPQMRISKVVQNDMHFTRTTTFLLLDEPPQTVLALNQHETVLAGPMHSPSQQDASLTEPLTIDFLANVLHALGGTTEEIALTSRSEGGLYVQVHLRDQHGQHTVAACLDDALQLARQENCNISVAPEILERRAVKLANYGATLQEQIAAVERLAESNPTALRPSNTEYEPHNLDFS